MYYSTTYLSPLGKITLACDACGKNLVGLWLEGQKYYQGTLKEALIEKDAVPLFDIAKKWLDRYFSGQKPDVAKSAAGTTRQCVSSGRLGNFMYDPLWRGNNLRQYC